MVDRAFVVGAGFAFTGAILTAVLIATRDSRAQVAAARAGDAKVATTGFNPCAGAGTVRAADAIVGGPPGQVAMPVAVSA